MVKETKKMNNLYVESIAEHISESIDAFYNSNIINERKIAIYGFDTFSFAIQSLLLNRNKSADFYATYDQGLALEHKRRIKGFAARYLRTTNDVVGIEVIGDIDIANTILLVASKLAKDELKKLYSDGFVQNENLFILYDWTNNSFDEFVKGKKEISLREIQILEKDILAAFDEFCIKNNLRYWVCGGTLLGTIRHKGFIPWDDDIDVFMPWEDYQRLIKLYTDNEKYRLACLDKDEYRDCYYSIWAKFVENTTILREDATVEQRIHPAWIDIFPLIGMPQEESDRIALQKEVIEVERRFTENFYRGNGSIRKRNEAYEGALNIYKRYDFDTSDYVGVIGTVYREKDCTTRAVYNDTIRMQFEDMEVNVPGGYKEYLDNLYGTNWMEIPEEGKRHTHDLEAYWL